MKVRVSLPVRSICAIAFSALLAACQAPTPENLPGDFQVTLERGPCFGTCPVYTLAISADGTTVYEGIRFVTVEGRQEATLGPDEVQAIFQAVLSSDFFDLDDSYIAQATDLPSITIAVTMDGRTKTVYHYGLACGTEFDDAPAELCDLEAVLEGIPVTNGWVPAS